MNQNRSAWSSSLDQATKKDIVLDSDKSRIADSETNQVVAESKKFTNWHKKTARWPN